MSSSLDGGIVDQRRGRGSSRNGVVLKKAADRGAHGLEDGELGEGEGVATGRGCTAMCASFVRVACPTFSSFILYLVIL